MFLFAYKLKFMLCFVCLYNKTRHSQNNSFSKDKYYPLKIKWNFAHIKISWKYYQHQLLNNNVIVGILACIIKSEIVYTLWIRDLNSKEYIDLVIKIIKILKKLMCRIIENIWKIFNVGTQMIWSSVLCLDKGNWMRNQNNFGLRGLSNQTFMMRQVVEVQVIRKGLVVKYVLLRIYIILGKGKEFSSSESNKII